MAKGRFTDQVVMITGAAGGFGSAAAHRFAKEGAKLILSDIDKSGLEQVRDELRDKNINIISQHIDISIENEILTHIQHAISELGPIDVAINNAGIGQHLQPLIHTTEAEFDRIMRVNTKGVFLGMKHQLPGMIERGKGVILNVASAAGLVGAGHMAAYAASKHAVVGLTRAAADEVARNGIRINAICPSFAPTTLFNDVSDELGGRHGLDRGQANKKMTSRIPMRRLARVDEVVQAMLWACDPENSFMTGQAISIDGGLTAV